jgi:MoxR-like ATPase
MTGADGGARGGLLVGRDAEQALIAARLADREVGTAILIRGPAGIGKTALIDEAVRRVGMSRRDTGASRGPGADHCRGLV